MIPRVLVNPYPSSTRWTCSCLVNARRDPPWVGYLIQINVQPPLSIEELSDQDGFPFKGEFDSDVSPLRKKKRLLSLKL
jgi:hypothetical protein